MKLLKKERVKAIISALKDEGAESIVAQFIGSGHIEITFLVGSRKGSVVVSSSPSEKRGSHRAVSDARKTVRWIRNPETIPQNHTSKELVLSLN